MGWFSITRCTPNGFTAVEAPVLASAVFHSAIQRNAIAAIAITLNSRAQQEARRHDEIRDRQ